MELIRSALFLFLLLSLHCFTRGRPQALYSEEAYEIDYRGPETHSSIPPPHHSLPFPTIKGEENPKRKPPAHK